MVRGLKLKCPPEMDKYTEKDILTNLDVLDEIPDINIPSESGKTTTREFEGRKYHTIITEYENKNAVDSVMTVVSTLEEAMPKMIKCFLWDDNKVVVAFPTLKDPGKPNIYQQIISELLRFTTFVIAEYNNDICPVPPVERIRKYIELFIKY